VKSLLMTAVVLISTSAFANPFDGFVGEYKASSAPQITSDQPRWCNWMNFQNVTGLRVEKNTSESKQSHVLYVLSSDDQMDLPIKDFNKSNLFNTRGSYGKTSGTSTSALSEFGAWGSRDYTETYTASLEKTATGYSFKLTEALHDKTELVAACSYQVQLTKQQ